MNIDKPTAPRNLAEAIKQALRIGPAETALRKFYLHFWRERIREFEGFRA